MRTVPFRQVFDRTVRLYGRDPRTNIPSDMRDGIVDHINDRVRTICQGWRWPEWEVTEERAFRQVWRDDHQYLRVSLVDGKPDEVFYLGDGFAAGDTEFGDNFGYYRVVSTAVSDPPVGSVPGTDTDFFEAIDPLDTFIAYDQGCKPSIGIVRGVYNANPRVPTCGCGSGLLKYRPSEKGIDICGSGNSTVFVTYSMPVPEYTMLPWVSGKTYARSDIVFDFTTGECFQALTTTTSPVSITTDWRRVPFPDKWSDYVTKGGFADSLMEFDQGGNADLQAKMVLQQFWSQQADDALQGEVDALVAQGQKLVWSFCRQQMRCWCETPLFTGGSVTTLTDECSDGWLYPVPPPPDTNPCDTTYHPEIVAILTADGTPSLEGLTTATRAITCTQITITILVGDTPEAQIWRLDSGAADPDDGGQVAPSDYDLTTNNKHWLKVG
jgi:hypothetical protein